MLYFERGSEQDILTSKDMKEGLLLALEKLGRRNKVMVVPPDFTRYHSRAGELTTNIYEYYRDAVKDILPSLSTRYAMTKDEIAKMYKGIPRELFRVHDWRNDVETVGTIPSEKVKEITEGVVDYEWPAQLNKLIWKGGHDLIISVGQVVPHEVMGMANYNKNLFVGTGGSDGINKSHFAGAAYGMERMMGRAINPVRNLLNFASDNFTSHLPILYVHTVIGRDSSSGKLVTRGLFIGDDVEVLTKAAELSLKVNFSMLEKPLKKVVVYLDPAEFKSTWLGNKSIYRTRMALADDSELIVLAPGLKEFGEDKEIDRLIRKYGYRGTESTMDRLKNNKELRNNLSAAAHLIHGSSEGRFNITYCPGYISKEEIESVNYKYGDLKAYSKKYNPELLKEGFNLLGDGEEIFYISNPATGLWAYKERFGN